MFCFFAYSFFIKMADQLASVTEPLRSINRRNTNPSSPDLATMSRKRLFCVQSVTLLTACITCFTLLSVTLLKNEELQKKLLNFGQTANCLLNATANDQNLIPTKEDSDAANWNNFFAFILRLSSTCAAVTNNNNNNNNNISVKDDP